MDSNFMSFSTTQSPCENIYKEYFLEGQRKESVKMSFCGAFLFPEKAYLIADSRIIDTNTSEVKNDEYIKIVQIPDKNVFVVSAGQADFFYNIKDIEEKKTLSDIINSIDFSSCNTFSDICDIIYNKFSELYFFRANIALNLLIVGSLSGKFYFKEISFFNQGVFISKDNLIYNSIDKKGRDIIVGSEKAKNVFREIMKNESFSETFKKEEKEIIDSVNEWYHIIKFLDKTVGGPVRILKITTDSYEWLQNKPNIPE